MTVTINNIQVDFHLSPPTITFLQGCSMVIDDIRDTLRAIEETDEGRAQPTTSIVKASGNEAFSTDGSVKNALTITILSPYVMKFEAGAIPFQSSVGNLLGTFIDSPGAIVQINNAVGSLNLQNSQIEFASFNGGISFDQTSIYSGTAYPVGTPQAPVNNLADAKAIGAARGLSTLFILGVGHFVSGDELTSWTLIGKDPNVQHCHTFGGGILTNCSIFNCHTAGSFYGTTNFHDCWLGNITHISGAATDCVLSGTIKLEPTTGSLTATDCHQGVNTDPKIDCQGDASFNLSAYNGKITILNKSAGSTCAIDINSGQVILDSTLTGGTLNIRGIASFTNNSLGAIVNAEGLITQNVKGLQFSIESLRQTHQGFGKVYYVDPISGSDSYDGLTEKSPFYTVNYALTQCVSGRGDVLILLAPGVGAANIAEKVTVNVEDLHIRGPGRGVQFQPAAGDGTQVIKIAANNCSLSGFVIRAPAGSTADDCLCIEAKFFRGDKLYIVGTETGTGNGIHIDGGDYHEFIDCESEKNGGHGIYFFDENIPAIGSPREVSVIRGNYYLNKGDGIRLSGISSNSTRINRILGPKINNNTGYGIYIEANVQNTFVSRDTTLFNNGLGPIVDLGFQTRNEIFNSIDVESKLQIMEHILRGRVETDPNTGLMTIYDEANNPILTGAVWENIAGTQPYRGQGADRRDRLT